MLDKLTMRESRQPGDGRGDRFAFVRGDIADADLVDRLAAEADAIVNFAAESHVDHSIEQPGAFIRTDVVGTFVLARGRAAPRHGRFLQISTDEVYGASRMAIPTEDDPLRPPQPILGQQVRRRPARRRLPRDVWPAHAPWPGEQQLRPFQYPEKIIPLFITNAIDDEPLPLYGDGLRGRDWLYVDDHCDALEIVLAQGEPGATSNVGASKFSNIELTRAILELLDKPMDLVRSIADRAGHDRRYAVDATRLHGIGWRPAHDFADALAETVGWYRDNEAWWRR